MKQLAGPAVPLPAGSAITCTVPGQLDMRVSLAAAGVPTVRRIVADHLELWGTDLEGIRARTLIAVNELLTALLPADQQQRLDIRLLVQRVPGGLYVNLHHRPLCSKAPARGAGPLLRVIASDYGTSVGVAGTDTWVSILGDAR